MKSMKDPNRPYFRKRKYIRWVNPCLLPAFHTRKTALFRRNQSQSEPRNRDWREQGCFSTRTALLRPDAQSSKGTEVANTTSLQETDQPGLFNSGCSRNVGVRVSFLNSHPNVPLQPLLLALPLGVGEVVGIDSLDFVVHFVVRCRRHSNTVIEHELGQAWAINQNNFCINP